MKVYIKFFCHNILLVDFFENSIYSWRCKVNGDGENI
jgi:hypothetical protein